jgi:hypothetical protein
VLRHVIAVLLWTGACLAQAAPNLAGTWAFTQDNNRFSGRVVLRQSGDHFTGTWHTSQGKTEPDTTVSARLYGNTLMLTRLIDKNNQQNYLLTLSADGKHLDGYGQGWFLNHTNLNMTKVADAPASQKPVIRRPAQTASPAQNPASSTSQQSSAGLSSEATRAKKQTWMGIGLPPARGAYSWVIQSVAAGVKGGKKYSSFYYEVATGRSVEEPLSLPAGG